MIAAFLALLIGAGVVPADEQEIRRLVQQTADGWNRGDADAIASVYAEDADNVGVTGVLTSGRTAIAAALRAAIERSRNQISIRVEKVRFLTPDVAIVHVRREYGGGPSAARPSISTSVFHKSGGRWRVAAFQNTYVDPHAKEHR